jgi:hypothetical protein
MSISINNINKLIEGLDKEEEVDEASVTGDIAGYETPNAFVGDSKEDEDEWEKDSVKSTGYKVVGENMSTFKKMMLGEVSYKTYKTDPTLSSKQKVNTSIKEINKKLYEIERAINHAVKLKTEDGVDTGQYWKSTNHRLRKISERLLKISHRTRKFGE